MKYMVFIQLLLCVISPASLDFDSPPFSCLCVSFSLFLSLHWRAAQSGEKVSNSKPPNPIRTDSISLSDGTTSIGKQTH